MLSNLRPQFLQKIEQLKAVDFSSKIRSTFIRLFTRQTARYVISFPL